MADGNLGWESFCDNIVNIVKILFGQVVDNQLIFALSVVVWKLIHSFNEFSPGTYELKASKRVLMKDNSKYELISKYGLTALEA